VVGPAPPPLPRRGVACACPPRAVKAPPRLAVLVACSAAEQGTLGLPLKKAALSSELLSRIKHQSSCYGPCYLVVQQLVVEQASDTSHDFKCQQIHRTAVLPCRAAVHALVLSTWSSGPGSVWEKLRQGVLLHCAHLFHAHHKSLATPLTPSAGGAIMNSTLLP
jgi:hypothetical protein